MRRSCSVRPRSFLSLAIALVLSIVFAGRADGRCTNEADLNALADALKIDIGCRANLVTGVTSSCITPPFPACAGDTPAEITDLVTGSDPPTVDGWTPSTLRCQRDIALASLRYLSKRLAERASGRRRAHEAKRMRRVEKSCSKAMVEQNQGGEELVRVGAPCSSILGSVGAPIEGHRLALCLRAVLEAKIDDIAPTTLPPNIILILTDDQRYDTPDVVMPATAALRDEAISFSNAFAASPLCAPSRASILTGQYARNHGVVNNAAVDALDTSDTLATWLSDAGYTNGLFGKYLNNSYLFGLDPPPGWHEWQAFLEASGGAYYGFALNDNGVERTFSNLHYSTDWLRNDVLRFIRHHAEEPFFVLYAPFAPHDPSIPAHKYAGAFSELPPLRRPNWFDTVGNKPTWVRFYREIAESDLPSVLDARYTNVNRTLRSVDDAVGHILELLEKEGLSDNTVIVYTSDHGLPFGEHWLQTKFNPYEESIRVPYIVRYPRRYPLPGVRDQIALNIDIAPTLADFAGAVLPEGRDGTSLAAVMNSAAAPGRDEFLIQSPGEFITSPSDSVRTERWKYIDTDAATGITQELYDLESDPYEQTNLAADPGHADVLADMMTRLDGLRGP